MVIHVPLTAKGLCIATLGPFLFLYHIKIIEYFQALLKLLVTNELLDSNPHFYDLIKARVRVRGVSEVLVTKLVFLSNYMNVCHIIVIKQNY